MDVAASDRWRVLPSVAVDYGVRFDHYDYLSEPSLVSPHAGLGIEVVPGTIVRASTSQRMIAPGADEFLPPSESGPWLPPVRTFVSLVPDAPVGPERIRRHAAGLDKQLGPGGAGKLTVEWFSEDTNNQMATLFGLDAGSDGGTVLHRDRRARGGHRLARGARRPDDTERHRPRGIHGRQSAVERHPLGHACFAPWNRPSRGAAARASRTSEDASTSRVPATFTHFTIGYQVTRLDPVAARVRSLADDGFDIELRQRLPYQPLTAGMLHVVFTLSTLLHQHDAESLYDEVLTVQAPARLTAGIQLGF